MPPATSKALLAANNDADWTTAEHKARDAVRRWPGDPVGWKVLGGALLATGDLKDALMALVHAVRLAPQDAELHGMLGRLLRAMGLTKEAEAAYRCALSLQPDHVPTHNNLAVLLASLGRLADAEASYREALRLQPDSVETLISLGVLLADTQRFAEAEALYQRAAEIRPAYTPAYSNRLMCMSYMPSRSVEDCRAVAEQFGQMVERAVPVPFNAWPLTHRPQRLKIGLVSGDLGSHPVGFFLESVLAHLDPAQVEVTAYVTRVRNDDVTERLRTLVPAWKSLIGMSDEAAARLIHNDGIHILMDLSGHTAHNRLSLFAYKAAPVQVSWLGYFATTGLTRIDYVLGDRHVTPTGEAAQYTESLWRLPDSYLCFTPPAVPVTVGPLPALSAGVVTFGCFNTLIKMNDAVVASWARVLHAVPQSRLFLKAHQLGDEETHRQTVTRFAAQEIAEDRLILEGKSPLSVMFEAYNRVDMVLDPFPFPGGTTSTQALWMGVPVLTRKGDRFLAHLGETVVTTAGLPEWVAADDADFLAKAVAFASDLPRLAALRAALRGTVMASPLFDARRYARNLEDALWGMWREKTGESG